MDFLVSVIQASILGIVTSYIFKKDKSEVPYKKIYITSILFLMNILFMTYVFTYFNIQGVGNIAMNIINLLIIYAIYRKERKDVIDKVFISYCIAYFLIQLATIIAIKVDISNMYMIVIGLYIILIICLNLIYIIYDKMFKKLITSIMMICVIDLFIFSMGISSGVDLKENINKLIIALIIEFLIFIFMFNKSEKELELKSLSEKALNENIKMTSEISIVKNSESCNLKSAVKSLNICLTNELSEKDSKLLANMIKSNGGDPSMIFYCKSQYSFFKSIFESEKYKPKYSVIVKENHDLSSCDVSEEKIFEVLKRLIDLLKPIMKPNSQILIKTGENKEKCCILVEIFNLDSEDFKLNKKFLDENNITISKYADFTSFTIAL